MKSVFPVYHIGHFTNEPHHPRDFELLRFSTMAEPDVEDFHRHTFYEILWTERGASRQIIDYQEYEVLPNTLFFISPNQVHHFEEWKPLRGGTILFTEDFYLLNRTNRDSLFELSFLDNLYANPCVQFDAATFRQVRRIIHNIETEHARRDAQPAIIQSYLHILLAEVQRFVDTSGDSLRPRKYLVLFKQFKQLLENHFAASEGASFYAQRLHITTPEPGLQDSSGQYRDGCHTRPANTGSQALAHIHGPNDC